MSARSFFTSTFMRVWYCFGMRNVMAAIVATTTRNVRAMRALRRLRIAPMSAANGLFSVNRIH